MTPYPLLVTRLFAHINVSKLLPIRGKEDGCSGFDLDYATAARLPLMLIAKHHSAFEVPPRYLKWGR
jgi:hypothetical protein